MQKLYHSRNKIRSDKVDAQNMIIAQKTMLKWRETISGSHGGNNFAHELNSIRNMESSKC